MPIDDYVRPITGPYQSLGEQAAAKRKQSQAVDELRLMAKETLALADRAYSLDKPLLGDILMTAAGMARNSATVEENK